MISRAAAAFLAACCLSAAAGPDPRLIVRRAVARDGKPLPPDQEAREKARFDREVAKRAAKPEGQRAREDAEALARDRKTREFLLQIPDLFEFTLAREDILGDRPVWVIAAAPRGDAKPKGLAAADISKLFGRLWIDKAGERWVKVEAEARTTIRFGVFLGSLSPGSRVEFEQVRMAEDVWLPLRSRGRLAARVVVKKFNVEEETKYRDYRRFTTASRIVPED